MFRSKNASRRDWHSVKTEAQVRREHWRLCPLFKYPYTRRVQSPTFTASFHFCRQESIHRIGCATIRSGGMYRATSYIKLEDAFLVTFRFSPGNQTYGQLLRFVGSFLGPTPGRQESIRAKIRCAPRILAPTSLTY